MNKQAYQCDYQNDGCYQQGFKSPTFYFHKTISRNKIKQTADEICPNDKQNIVSFFGSVFQTNQKLRKNLKNKVSKPKPAKIREDI